MSRRRDHNRDARRATLRRAALQEIAKLQCPDCNSEQTLTEPQPGVTIVSVAHDSTCPRYRAIAEHQPGDH